FCCLNVQIQYGANDAFLTRGVHPIIPERSTSASLPRTVTDPHVLRIHGVHQWTSGKYLALKS
ncbi:hypothetical protein L9G15_22105, partial [Shewanella sp. A3A]|nr:hypothetical protein [Shewanella ferrihydritica]